MLRNTSRIIGFMSLTVLLFYGTSNTYDFKWKFIPILLICLAFLSIFIEWRHRIKTKGGLNRMTIVFLNSLTALIIGLIVFGNMEGREEPVLKESVQNPVYVKDSSQYSSSFLVEAEEVARTMGPLQLDDSLMIIENAGTFFIPQIPPIGSKIQFTAKQEELAMALTVERLNQVKLKYRLEMVEFGHVSYQHRGEAELSAHFYLGAESDDDPQSGVAYFPTEFYDDNDSCYFHIRIGQPEGKKHLLAKVVKNCNGKLRDIFLNNYPTLMEKNRFQ